MVIFGGWVLGNILWIVIINAIAFLTPFNFNQVEYAFRPWGWETWHEVEDKYWDHDQYNYPIFDGRDFFTLWTEQVDE